MSCVSLLTGIIIARGVAAYPSECDSQYGTNASPHNTIMCWVLTRNNHGILRFIRWNLQHYKPKDGIQNIGRIFDITRFNITLPKQRSFAYAAEEDNWQYNNKYWSVADDFFLSLFIINAAVTNKAKNIKFKELTLYNFYEVWQI